MEKIYNETYDLWEIKFTKDEIDVLEIFGDKTILQYNNKLVDNDEFRMISAKLEEAWKKYENLFSENLKEI